MKRAICKTGIILGAKIHPKGSILTVPEDISADDIERLLASGEEIEEYTGEKATISTPIEEAAKPLSIKEVQAKLKELGVKIPFGSDKETLSKMLEEATREKA